MTVEKKTQKVAAGDLSGVVQCFSVKKSEFAVAFKTIPNAQAKVRTTCGRPIKPPAGSPTPHAHTRLQANAPVPAHAAGDQPHVGERQKPEGKDLLRSGEPGELDRHW